MTRIFAFATAAIMAFVFAGAAVADSIAPPKGDVILTVTGAINATNVEDSMQLDREAFIALGLETVETSTIWTEGKQTFEGVSLKTLAEVLGVENGTFLATAINDYTVEIPVSDAVENGPIIAVLLNGEPMSVRDKGPLWVIYPYDQDDAYGTEVIYSRSIWQLDRIEVAE